MTGDDRLSLAALGATFAAGVPLFTVTEDRSYLLLGLLLMGCSVAIGAFTRRLGAREVSTRLAQLLPVLLLPWLVPALRDPWRLAARTIDHVQQSFAPMPYSEGFAVFAAAMLWVTFLVVETLAVGSGTPAWTFPVLVMPYAVCALAIYTETNPLLFGFPALGFILVLATGVRNGALATLPAGARERRWRTGVTRAAATAGSLALVFSVVLSVPIAERSGNAANPGGTGAVQLGDPSIDLIRNITSSSDERVISYTTTDSAGQYLRLAALPDFDDRGFHLSAMDLIRLPLQADLPEVDGRTVVRTSVKIDNLSSEYLPMPWVPTGANVADNWLYDPRTMAVVAVGDGRRSATRNLEYTVSSARLPEVDEWLPDLEQPGQLNDNGFTLDLPDGISPAVRQLAQEKTAGATTAGQQALALRDFLRSDAFTYSLAAGQGSTLQTLDDFLLGSRIGYCEQYAGALAVMARMINIPSRVVIGFLPGKKVGNHWEVSTRNMHAWTELYFGDDVGWVQLDPTPGGAVGRPTPSASPSARPSSASATPTASRTSEAPVVVPPVPAGQVTDVGSGTLPAVAGGLAGILLVAGGPLLVRRLLRWRRLAVRTDSRRAVEDAWAEVRAVAIDRGATWPRGTSRQVAAVLGPELDVRAAAGLTDLALLVERSRYSGEVVAANELATRVGLITGGMKRRWARPTAWVRRWWPRSLWPQRPSS